ncbi:MAG: iron-containing redox enzyme family protein [Bdellovibrionaceae bacterium]|nr:iron-containing redox enzyme family protein [Bdellovibrio sp.]
MSMEQKIKHEMAKTKDVLLNYPWADPLAYGMWLAQTYYMVSHSTRLVALAGACVPLGQESLHGRFVDHSKEERGHQLVCIADIKSLGFELNDFPQTYQAQAMYQIQYYWIQHRGAASFFGYTMALECLAEYYGPQVAARLLAAHGPKSTKFIQLHSEDDQDHTQEAYKHIKKLTPTELAAAEENLELSTEIYRSMLVEAQIKLKGISLRSRAA